MDGDPPARVKWLIVGAGMTGAAAAYQLVAGGEDPDAIAVIDGARPGLGASGRNGGFAWRIPCWEEIGPWRAALGEAGVRDLLEAGAESQAAVSAFCERENVPMQRGGGFDIAERPEDLGVMERHAAFLRDAGWQSIEVRPQCPGPDPELGPVTHDAEAFGVQPAIYTGRLLRASGVRVSADCPAQAKNLFVTGGAVLVNTPRGGIEAERVILATNAFLWLGFRTWVGDYPVIPGRNQVLLAAIAGEADNRLWGDGTYNHGFDYWRQLPDGNLLLGGGRDRDMDGETTFALGPNDAVLAYLENEKLPRLTGGRPAEVLARWSGILGFSPDRLPLMGVLPWSEGRIGLAAGFSGHGFRYHWSATRRLIAAMRDGDAGALGVFHGRRLGEQNSHGSLDIS
ncbi:MAG: FAD-binding oxidoreductase [Sumerlaeia bacterium]